MEKGVSVWIAGWFFKTQLRIDVKNRRMYYKTIVIEVENRSFTIIHKRWLVLVFSVELGVYYGITIDIFSPLFHHRVPFKNQEKYWTMQKKIRKSVVKLIQALNNHLLTCFLFYFSLLPIYISFRLF